MLVFTQYIKNYHEIFQHNLVISMEIYIWYAHTHKRDNFDNASHATQYLAVSHEQGLRYLTL